MKDARLYINNQEIEFSNAPDVLFTFQEDDLTNPTIVKNSYTKTVTIPGTPNNNSIFDGIWNVERIQGDDNFNVTKRVPFSLYVNGDIYQTGYAKLDKISRNNNKIEYSITLYGGLGQFLYNLSIDWNSGDKKTLADMDYFKSSESEEAYDLGFTINKDTVASAWTQINSNDKWGVVNFAPTYLGYPDKISCDKVLINFSGNTMTSAVTDGSSAFTPSGGFALGTSPQKLTSEEVRDYRSYIQTPVMRVHSIIDAICRKENNAGRYDDGYEVVLDNEFFNTANPYYWDAWVTLPTITNLEFSSEGGGGTTTAYTANPVSSEWDINGNCLYTFELSETITGGNISVKATIDLGVTGTTNSDVLYFYYTQRYGRGQKVYKRNAYGLQLYASNSVTSSENILAGSNVKWLSGEQRYTYADAVASGQFTPKWNTNVVENHTGYFTRVSGSTFHYTGTSGSLLELRCDLPIGTRYFKLFMKRCNSSYSSERNMLFTSTLADTGDKINVTPLPFNSKTIELSSIDSGESISNKYISKEMLLSTSYSPADWLLSYCKKFGLYIKKDIIDDKIYILTRNNYYKRDNIIDIEKDIDLSKTFDINPVYCQNGYLSLTDEGVESKSESDYTQKTGKIYGQKIVNTGYEFNADTKELNNGIFKNAVQAKDVSQYYYKPNASGLYPYVYNGFKYNLYENGDYSGSTKEYNQPSADIAQTFEAFDENFPNYDLISKPMFSDTDGKSLDTENVLLFFNGYENVSQYNWMLTDDIAYMYKLNNNPTWLLTLVEEDMVGNKIAKKITNFPRFSRWLEGNRWMIYSFDYGSPRLLYVPEMTNNDEGNVYWNYYKKYYEDLYDVDTKVVDCNTLGKFNEESLRYVYWFRNRYWRLNKITDYNPTSYNTTKTQFISLNDINSLTNEVASRDLWLEVELDKYYLPQSGGTIIGTVRTSDNGPWTIESISISPSGDTAYTVTIDPMGGGSDSNFTVTTNANNTLDDKIVTIVVSAGDISKSVTFTQSGIDVSKEYFTLEVVSGNSLNIWLESTSVYGTGSGEPAKIYQYYDKVSSPKVYYKKSGDIWRYLTFETWNDGARSEYITGLTPGTKVQFRSEGALFTGDTSMDYRYCFGFKFSFGGDSKVVAYGNAMSLIYGSDFEGKETFKSKFYGLDELLSQSVNDDAHLIDAKHLHLPATATSISCYYRMFKGCKELKRAPSSIKATVLGRTSCVEMFEDCWSLTEAPEFNNGLTAYEACCTNMFRWCYSLKNAPSIIDVSLYDIQEPDLPDVMNLGYFGAMFQGCSGLTSTPTLPSNNLGYRCYFGMFADCTSLRNAPELPSLNLADGCYSSMFDGCTSLRTPPELPATTLAKYCYENMFEDCSNLARTPELPATVMTEGCYGAMFRRCSRLSNIKRIHATTMADSCFWGMFEGCTNLSTAPELPAITLAPQCYERMFFGCDRLSYIKCLAGTEYFTDDTLNWVSGVSESGLFIKNPDTVDGATYRWSRGVSGIPVGWSVEDSTDGYISIENWEWVHNIPASGGTATSANTTFRVIYHYPNGITSNVTSFSVITGSTEVSASTVESEHEAGMLTLTATYSGKTFTGSIGIIQDAYIPPRLTAITINDLTWVTDVPYYGGTASTANCSYTVSARYDNGDINDITNNRYLVIEGSSVISATTAVTRQNVGTLTLTANFGVMTDSDSVSIYQEGAGYSVDYLTFNISSDGIIDCPVTQMYYSINNGAWTEYLGTPFSVVNGDIVKFKNGSGNYPYSTYNGSSFSGTTAGFEVQGNIMSMLYGDDFLNKTNLNSYQTNSKHFQYFFRNCSGMTSAENLVLPATGLSVNCYQYMFVYCSSLTKTPKNLPATTLTYGCYDSMFTQCSALTTVMSILPATELQKNCYSRMFYNCPNITIAPELPAETLVEGCYNYMFGFCSNLSYIKCLATDISASSCTNGWLHNNSVADGTFVKNANMNDWTTGTSGIPSGWTIIDA